MRMLVLGAGLQGSACAFDLLQNPDVREVRLADLNVEHLPSFLAPYSGPRLLPTRVDVRSREAVLALMRHSDAVMSAIPYYFNFPLAELAVEAGVHFSDLGGNTEIVFQQKGLGEKAAAQGVTVIPDCGLAPGMVNVLAQYGIGQLDTVDSVRMFVGGLPQTRPLIRERLSDRIASIARDGSMAGYGPQASPGNFSPATFKSRPEVIGLFERTFELQVPAAYIRSVEILLGASALDVVPSVTVPVASISGLDDQYAPPDHVHDFLARLRAPAKTTILPDVGHLPFFEAPEAFAVALGEFLAIL